MSKQKNLLLLISVVEVLVAVTFLFIYNNHNNLFCDSAYVKIYLSKKIFILKMVNNYPENAWFL